MKKNKCNLPEETNCRLAKVTIPKPHPLIGSKRVYQKEGLPYWFCKIGKDEFMHLYLEDLTIKDILFDSMTKKKREFKTKKENNIGNYIINALNEEVLESKWIPVYEPSLSDIKEKLQFVPNVKPKVDLECTDWEELFEQYSPENNSKMTNINIVFLLQLRWLKDGMLTVKSLTNPKYIGNYYCPGKPNKLEPTGTREIGGLYGFVGNTCNIVKDPSSKSGYSFVGGGFNYKSSEYSLANVYPIRKGCEFIIPNSVGIMEMKCEI